jgi:hypothetical protein
MIYKKPGVIELDKLRVIHLFEADFNLLIGVYFGRRAMYHQVDRQLLPHGQFGKPGGECQDAALSKVLHNLISSLTKTPMGQFESDANACFDGEVMSFVLTCFRSRGAPTGPLQMWEQVLQNVVHEVKPPTESRKPPTLPPKTLQYTAQAKVPEAVLPPVRQ